jgi:predicted outer membrane repeat protein
MADRNRRFALAKITLLLLFLAMSGLARAATFTVINTNDTGIGSLRAAITSANAAPTVVNNINFTVSGTITLGSSLPAIANTSPGSLTIDGSGQAITVDGANSFQILSVNSGATLTLHNLTIANGSAEPVPFAGGGILNDGTLTVTNSTFSGNSAGIRGGGVFTSGTMTVTNTTFSGNSAPGSGGGIANDGTLTVTNSTFSGNTVIHDGGGIENDGTLTVTNSTFFGNSAGGLIGGGAILNESAGTLKVTNSTFFENSSGGGINNFFGSAVLKGTILADETGGNCGGIATPPVTDAGYNISDDDSCGFSGTSVNGSTTLHLDPAGLQNNGGPTKTIALESNSEAIDFIPVADCTDQSSLPLNTDQRGFTRPDPGNPDFCDAGAFELTTMPFAIAPNSERVQIARSTTPNSDQINMAFTFTENGFPACDAADDAFNGFFLVLESGTCAVHDHTALQFFLNPWVVHTVNHMSYGTLFNSAPPLTVSGRMVALPTPPAPACGEWTLNLEIAGVDSTPLGNGPFSLILSNEDGDEGCFEITNAIVGSQLPKPSHGVRRRVRR